MSRNRDPRGQLQQDGLLANHYRQGSVFTPELAATLSVNPDDILRDHVPNLLWILGIVTLEGDNGLREFCHLQKRFISKCRDVDCNIEDVRLDGQLTALTKFNSKQQEILRECIEESVSDEVLSVGVLGRALSRYENPPGIWLFNSSEDSPIDDIDFLRACILNYCSSDHIRGIVTLPSVTWLILNDKLGGQPSVFELIKEYVDDEIISPLLPSMLRSLNLAERQILQISDEGGWASSIEWAQVFWRTNATLCPCIVEVDANPMEPSDENVLSQDAVSEELLEALTGRHQQFVNQALSDRDCIDLYDPSCHEVVCGVVERSYRLAATWAQYPELWMGVYSTFVQRTLIENCIRLKWMGMQDKDIFVKFQQYGLGKQKLHLQILRDVARRLSDSGSEMPAMFAQLLEQYESSVGFQEEYMLPVNVGNFEQRNLREMAEEAGMMDIYRTMYQVTSGVAHCEWEFIEHYEMNRCLEPLHRGHALPLAGHIPPTLEFGLLLQNQFQMLVEIASEILQNQSN